jgi:hypothetical protein
VRLHPAYLAASPTVFGIALSIGSAHPRGPTRTTHSGHTAASSGGASRTAHGCAGTAVSTRSARRTAAGVAPRAPSGQTSRTSALAPRGTSLRIAARRSTGASTLRSARSAHVPHTHVGQAGESREARAVQTSATLRPALAFGRIVVASSAVAARAGNDPQRRNSVDHPAYPSSAKESSHCRERSHARFDRARRSAPSFFHVHGVPS